MKTKIYAVLIILFCSSYRGFSSLDNYSTNPLVNISAFEIKKVLICSLKELSGNELKLIEVATPITDKETISKLLESIDSATSLPAGIPAPLGWILVHPVFIGTDGKVICMTSVQVGTHVIKFSIGTKTANGNISIVPESNIRPLASKTYYEIIYHHLTQYGHLYLDDQNALTLEYFNKTLEELNGTADGVGPEWR